MIPVSNPKKLTAYADMPIVKPRDLSVDEINAIIGFDVKYLFKCPHDLSHDQWIENKNSKSYVRNLLVVYLKYSDVKVKDIAFIMNLSVSRVFKIINTSMPPIFKGKNAKTSFMSWYAISKRITPINYFPYQFEKEIQKNADYLFLVFVRTVIEFYLSLYGYKAEQLTSDVMRFADQNFQNSTN